MPTGLGWKRPDVEYDRCPCVTTSRQDNGPALMTVVSNYRGFRIEIVAQFVDGAWNAGVRIRRTLSEMRVQQVLCQQPTAIEAEERGQEWAQRWVDSNAV